jgi:galactokinase
MDQFVSLQARQNHALMLDCRSLEFELLSVPESARMVICDTGVKHKLAGGEYNSRRVDCEAAVRVLQKELPEIRALRDVGTEDLERHRGLLTEVQQKRARHIVTENARVQDAAQALREGTLRRFGAKMAESHRSLRDDYEVSCAELDVMVELANQQEGVYGARMTGGGFGGATINLVDEPRVKKFVEEMQRRYQQETGIVPRIHVCTPVAGAERVATANLPGWP